MCNKTNRPKTPDYFNKHITIYLFDITKQYVYVTLIYISERVYQTHTVVVFTFRHGDAANPFLCHCHCTKQVFLCSFVLHWYLSFEYNYTVLYI